MIYNVAVVFSIHALLCVVDIYGLVNLALRKPTWEKHPWPELERDYGSENAVDGMYRNRSDAGGQCTISDDGKYTAEWRVDLGSVVNIKHINIYYRTDHMEYRSQYKDRLAGFFLYVSNSTTKDGGFLCFHDLSTVKSTISWDQKISCSVNGRYVIYYNERKMGVSYPHFYSKYAFNELCEVEVYGCNRSFGENCSHKCPTNCQGSICDSNTGHCFSCESGYKGLKCSQECRIGHYGKNCVHNCSTNCNVTSRCDRITGQCEGGCITGWTGNSCNQRINRQSCEESLKNILIVNVLISTAIIVTGSVINFIIWKRNAAKNAQMGLPNIVSHQNTTVKTKENEDQQYTELKEENEKCNTYEEMHNYSN
ncbi:uncharacterized protein LOC128170528 [Crassostrea angulata]|uniref:uncharacterized protein LOC128170528 n=1 Tax=Magallana angulata TaxID=2784310 RepID=UPI0022B211DE|nr:uncharacterized protein LOC128170528 [Crassostrea angulata]